MGIGPRIDGPKVHDLKCDAGYYEAVALGHKTAELRLNDRDFSPLDILRLHENEFGRPTGRTIEKQVTHIVWDSNGPWLAPGHCMLSLADVPQSPKRRRQAQVSQRRSPASAHCETGSAGRVHRGRHDRGADLEPRSGEHTLRAGHRTSEPDGATMRDLTRHPITILEIEVACSRAALLIEENDSVGDRHPSRCRDRQTGRRTAAGHEPPPVVAEGHDTLRGTVRRGCEADRVRALGLAKRVTDLRDKERSWMIRRWLYGWWMFARAVRTARAKKHGAGRQPWCYAPSNCIVCAVFEADDSGSANVVGAAGIEPAPSRM